MSLNCPAGNKGFVFVSGALLYLLVAVAMSALLTQSSRAPAFPELDALVQDAVEVCALNLTLDEDCLAYSLALANPLVEFCLNGCEPPQGTITTTIERDFPRLYGFSRLTVWVTP